MSETTVDYPWSLIVPESRMSMVASYVKINSTESIGVSRPTNQTIMWMHKTLLCITLAAPK